MKDNVLLLLFIGVPLCVVVGQTMAVDSHWSDRWETPKVKFEILWKRPGDVDEYKGLPDRFGAITKGGKPLDEKTTGSILVKAVFAGDKMPVQTPLDMSAYSGCVNEFAEYPKATQVNADKSVPWVFVTVKNAPKGVAVGKAMPRTMDQIGCVYRPHVIGVVKGQELWIYNMEAEEAHNVKMEGFNQGQSAQGKEQRHLLEEGIHATKCELHKWMSALIHVVPHPFFCTTVNAYKKDKDGNRTAELESCQGVIKRLPPGEYTLTVWHETFKGVDVKVTVKAGETVTATVKVQ